MEASRLNAFFRSVVQWPKNLAELDVLTNQVAKLLLLEPVFVWLPELGVAAAGKIPPGEFPDILSFVQTQVDQAYGNVRPESGQVRHLQLSTNSVSHWALCPIVGRDHHEWGWVLVGSDRVINGKVELLLISLIDHLLRLAEAAQAKIAVSERDQFLSIASHELKTPLTSIYGVLQLQERMSRQTKGPVTPELEKQQSFLKITIRQVERLNELINGLLDVSRIQNGRFVVDPSDVDAAELLNETVNARLKVIAQEAGVRIQVESPESLPAWVDPIRFEETVTNLGMNAIRFSPEGGVVWIKLEAREGFLILRIRDQGPSLSESDQARIFQAFERAQRTSRLGGLGLGLFISRQIAQLHGGNVVLVESVPGKGSVFEASFPLRKADVRRIG